MHRVLQPLSKIRIGSEISIPLATFIQNGNYGCHNTSRFKRRPTSSSLYLRCNEHAMLARRARLRNLANPAKLNKALHGRIRTQQLAKDLTQTRMGFVKLFFHVFAFSCPLLLNEVRRLHSSLFDFIRCDDALLD